MAVMLKSGRSPAYDPPKVMASKRLGISWLSPIVERDDDDNNNNNNKQATTNNKQTNKQTSRKQTIKQTNKQTSHNKKNNRKSISTESLNVSQTSAAKFADSIRGRRLAPDLRGFSKRPESEFLESMTLTVAMVGTKMDLHPGRLTWMFPKIGVFPPNHPILIGFSIINHPFWGIPIFGNTHMETENFHPWKFGQTSEPKHHKLMMLKVFSIPNWFCPQT